MKIKIKSEAELDAMRVSGRLTGQVLRQVAEAVEPGMTTGDLDEIARDLIKKTGGSPRS